MRPASRRVLRLQIAFTLLSFTSSGRLCYVRAYIGTQRLRMVKFSSIVRLAARGLSEEEVLMRLRLRGADANNESSAGSASNDIGRRVS